MTHWLLRPRLAPTILATCTIMLAGALTVQAQQSPPPGGGGQQGMRRSGGRPPMLDPVVLEGPPAPDSMAALVGLNGDGLARYTTMYQNLMASTRPQRDSVTAFREARRNARMGSGESPPREGGMDAMRSLRESLESRQKQFDQALEQDVLNHDQVKTYRDWRDQRRHDAEKRMRDMRGDTGNRDGGGPGT
jgi:hypothetical protein